MSSLTLTIKNQQGKEAGEHQPRFEPVPKDKGNQAAHDVVVAHRAAQRSGTASTKTMGEVAGTGKKPWRQKGTGRARAGSFASPLWRGGGVTHGPRPRNYRKKISRETKRLALSKALTERINSGEVILVDQLSVEKPSTKQFLEILNNLGLNTGTVLVVIHAKDSNLVLSSRNVRFAKVITSESLNTYETLKWDRILMTKEAFEKVENRVQAKGQES